MSVNQENGKEDNPAHDYSSAYVVFPRRTALKVRLTIATVAYVIWDFGVLEEKHHEPSLGGELEKGRSKLEDERHFPNSYVKARTALTPAAYKVLVATSALRINDIILPILH
jgi:hypothetical protein